MKFKEYDIIKVLNDFGDNISKGDIGSIIMVYSDPTEAYEVEFTNEDGTQKAQLVFQPYEIEAISID